MCESIPAASISQGKPTSKPKAFEKNDQMHGPGCYEARFFVWKCRGVGTLFTAKRPVFAGEMLAAGIGSHIWTSNNTELQE